MLDLHIGRSDKLIKFTRDDMLNYLYAKNQLLAMMFTCIHNQYGSDGAMTTMKQAILAELLSGVDVS